MPNPNHDAKGQFASGESAGAGLSSHDQGHQDLHQQTVAQPLQSAAHQEAGHIAQRLRMNEVDALGYARQTLGMARATGNHAKAATYKLVVEHLQKGGK